MSKYEVNMESIVSPSFFKQKARQLKKEKSLSQNQALEEAANQYGFSNYKHYLNVLEAGRKRKEAHLKSITLEKDMNKKAELAAAFIQDFKIPFHGQLDILNLFPNSDDSENSVEMQVLCKKLHLMENEIQSFVFNDFITGEGKIDIDNEAPHFIAKKMSISDLTYEIHGDKLCVDGYYVLTTEFEFELDEDDPRSKDERFNNREFFGTFDIRIDRNKKITIENSDIGEKMDSSFYSESFR